MSTEAYLEAEITYSGRVLDPHGVLTLIDAESDDPHGVLTSATRLAFGERGGPLIVVGRRDGKRWRVTLPEIEVYNEVPGGCEYLIFSGVQRCEVPDA